MANFTPGPWAVERCFGKSGTYATIRNAEDNHVCHVGLTCPADEADARLIAACPTMYDYILRRAEEGYADAAEIIASLR